MGYQVASYIPGPISHLSQDLANAGGEEVEGGIDHAAGLAACLGLLHEALYAHILIQPGHSVLGYALPRRQLLESHSQNRLMLSVEIDEALDVYVDEVVSRDHQEVVFDIEVANAVAQGVRAALVVVKRLVAEVLVIGDAQALEEAFPGFEVIAQVEGIACPFAAQDEPAAALTG